MLEKLQELGLSKKEAQVYVGLVHFGEATANQIAKDISSNRTVVYNVLQQLVSEGLVTYIKKQKKRFYMISNLQALLVPLKEKEKITKDLMKEIMKVQSRPSTENDVEVYDGIEGMKNVFEEIKKVKELRVINATGLIFDFLKYSAGHIVKEIHLNSRPKLIATQSMKKTPMITFKRQKVKYLPKEAENYATTFIYDNTIVIQVLKNKPFLIRIINKEISEGYKKDFDVLWARL